MFPDFGGMDGVMMILYVLLHEDFLDGCVHGYGKLLDSKRRRKKTGLHSTIFYYLIILFDTFSLST